MLTNGVSANAQFPISITLSGIEILSSLEFLNKSCSHSIKEGRRISFK